MDSLPKKKVGPHIIDMHSKVCKDCNERRLKIQYLFLIPMEPAEKHVDEIIARDMLLDQLYDDCCECFLSNFK